MSEGPKKLLGHYHQSIFKCCLGDPREQDIELQMCRGKYKAQECRNVLTPKGCYKGGKGVCPFLHPEDNRLDVARRSDEVRQRIFRLMSRDNYALPPCIRLEIDEITQEEHDDIMRRQYEHDQLVLDNKGKAGGKGLRTTRSRSPRSSPARSNPRTPTPDNANDNSGKGRGKGKGPTPAESTAATATPADVLGGADSRQRDHTSGQDEASDTEVNAPIPADTTVTEQEMPMIIETHRRSIMMMTTV